MPTFVYPWLAIAGAAAAAVPVIVHLLNQRRFQVVEWAAMDFLREALTRSRRMMELRDLLLLLLRVACLLAFGLALARPYWSRFATGSLADPHQPVHAVVLVDNSLSMSYEKPPAGILLDDAKAKAKEWIEGLPAGSAISVLPICGSATAVSYEAYSRREDALEALAAIQPVDRAARPAPAIDMALKACHSRTDLAAHRILLVTDQQVANWPADAERENLSQLPCRMEIEQVAPERIENVWVQDVEIRDRLASSQSPAIFTATIGYQGNEPRKQIPVVLKVDGKQAGSQLVDLQPGQMKDVIFPEYEFPRSIGPETSRDASPRFATVEVSIAGDQVPFDRLPADNHRAIVVPVAESLPVVFVDTLGTHEDAKKKIFGDTFWLRRWLAPPLTASGQERPLVQVRHMTIDELNVKTLADARLVVIAGVSQPMPEQVAVLKQYVEQGGNLIVAAGGSFDPAAWTRAAWQDGTGILPAPLASAPQGYVREDRRWETAVTPPLSLKFESLASHYFRPEGVGDDQLREALGLPTVFHKIVIAQCDEAVADRAAAAAEKYFGPQRKELADIDSQLAGLETAANVDSSQQKITDLQRRREKIRPSWLTWKAAAVQRDIAQGTVDDLVQRARPEVLARYSNDLPMLVRRRWGLGQVLFLSTSLSRDWTTLHELPQSAWLMDHIARCLLAETLTAWNIDSERGAVLPIAVGDHLARFTLVDPVGKSQAVSADALGGDRYGIGLDNMTQRGIYHLKAERSELAPGGSGALLWQIPLAVNGPAEESQLQPIEKSQAGDKSFIEVSANVSASSPLELEGVDLWKWLIGLVLVLLLAEFALAARSTSRSGAAT